MLTVDTIGMLEARRRSLRIVVVLILPDEQRHHPVWFCLLDSSDDGGELGDRQGNELFADDLSTYERRKGACPSRGKWPKL